MEIANTLVSGVTSPIGGVLSTISKPLEGVDVGKGPLEGVLAAIQLPLEDMSNEKGPLDGVLSAVRTPLDAISSVGGPLNGVFTSISTPLDGVLSGRHGDRLLSYVYSNLSSVGDLPIVGDLVDGSLLSHQHRRPMADKVISRIKSFDSLPNNRLINLPVDLIRVREQFVEAFVTATSLPADAIRQILDISELIADPAKRVLRSDISTFITEKKIVEIYATLDSVRLKSLRDTLASLRTMLPGNSDSAFMGRANLGLLDDVRNQLLSGVFANGPLGDLRESATSYITDVFPIIVQFTDVDSLLESTSLDLARYLGIQRYPLDSLSRLVTMQMGLLGEALDLKGGVVSNLADITEEILSKSVEISSAVKELALLASKIGIEFLTEFLYIAQNVSEGVVGSKVAVVEWVSKLPFEMVDVILGTPVEIFSDFEFANLDIFEGMWNEARSVLEMYMNYTNFLDLTPEQFPLNYFSDLSRGLLSRGAAIVAADSVFTQ